MDSTLLDLSIVTRLQVCTLILCCLYSKGGTVPFPITINLVSFQPQIGTNWQCMFWPMF